MVDFETLPEAEQGEFNSGLAIIYRLDTIHKNIHIASVEQDIDRYYHWLCTFWKELVRACRQNTKKDEEISELSRYRAYHQTASAAYYKIKSLQRAGKNIPITLTNILDLWEVELTLLEQEKGYGMPKKADPYYAMAN